MWVGQNYYTFLCSLTSAFLCLCPWVVALSPQGATECPVPLSLFQTAVSIVIFYTWLAFCKWTLENKWVLNYRFAIIFLISDSANSYNFADCKYVRKWQQKEQEYKSCFHYLKNSVTNTYIFLKIHQTMCLRCCVLLNITILKNNMITSLLSLSLGFLVC